jgi:hypothetical protein
MSDLKRLEQAPPDDLRELRGRGFFSPSMCRGVGAWLFENESDVPGYLRREAAQGRVFLFPDALRGEEDRP